MVVKPWSSELTLPEVDFYSEGMWIQVHGLPWNRIGDNTIQLIGLKLGKLLEINKLEYRDQDQKPFFRIQVDLNLHQLLVGGFPIPRCQLQPLWVQFKYEKLADLCYGCGFIGHILKTCRNAMPNANLSGVGPFMRADPATMRKATFSKGLGLLMFYIVV